jgi:hypothetical protein
MAPHQTNSNENTDVPILRYTGSTAGTAKLQEAIEKAWADVLQDPAARAMAAQELGVEPDQLQERFPSPPFRLHTERSGVSGFEWTLFFIAPFVLDVAKDLAKDAVIAGGKALWNVLKNKLKGQNLEKDALGKEAEVSEKPSQPSGSA